MPKKILKPKLTRQQQRDLDVEIQFMEGLVRRDSDYLEALQILGDDYTRRGKVAEGLSVDVKLTQLRPTDPLAHYNLACSYSLSGRIDLALKSLEQAIKLGYRDYKWMGKDPDLKNLRLDPGYKKIRAKLRTNPPGILD